MITYAEALAQVGYDSTAKEPTANRAFFAYKGGEAKQFATRREAEAYSNLIEAITINQAEIDEFRKQRRATISRGETVWREALREEFSLLSDAQFNYLYEKAYDDAHDEGYDAVGERLVALDTLIYEFKKL